VPLGSGGPGLSSRPYAEATQAAIDSAVASLLRHAEQRAVELRKTHLAELDALVNLLTRARDSRQHRRLLS